MAICKKCGAQIDDQAAFCPTCGAPQEALQQESPQSSPFEVGGDQQEPFRNAPNGNQYQQPYQAPVDNGGFGWGLLGFCIPLVGLILFLVWKDNKPRTAKAAGIGALVSVIVSAVIYIVIIALGIGVGVAGEVMQ